MELIIATYGEADAHHNTLTRQAAVMIAQQVKGQTLTGLTGYRVTNTFIEGDETKGRVIAICELVEPRTDSK